MSPTDVIFSYPSGPPVYAKYPRVFDRTWGDLRRDGWCFGLCFCVLGERRLWRARMEGVVKCEKRGFTGGIDGRKRIRWGWRVDANDASISIIEGAGNKKYLFFS